VPPRGRDVGDAALRPDPGEDPGPGPETSGARQLPGLRLADPGTPAEARWLGPQEVVQKVEALGPRGARPTRLLLGPTRLRLRLLLQLALALAVEPLLPARAERALAETGPGLAATGAAPVAAAFEAGVGQDPALAVIEGGWAAGRAGAHGRSQEGPEGAPPTVLAGRRGGRRGGGRGARGRCTPLALLGARPLGLLGR
jgi:hypothetical protein